MRVSKDETEAMTHNDKVNSMLRCNVLVQDAL